MTSEATALVMRMATFEETLLIQAIVLETFQVEVVNLGGVLKDTLHEGSSWEAM